MPPLTAALGSLASALLLTTASAQSCSNDKKVDYPAPKAADGWSYRLVADGFRRPRGIAFDSEGALLVVDSGVGVVHLTLKDDGGTCVSVDKNSTLIESDSLNHGIAISADGETLYASSSDSVFSWSYDASDPSTGAENRTLVTNMGGGGHTTRTILLPPSNPDMLLVSLGSQSNSDDKARDEYTGVSQIRIFDLSSLSDDDDPYDYTDGDVLGWGLRNSVGIAEHPDGGVWSVENSVDQLERLGTDIHQDNPAEELNYHGPLGGGGDEMGANYGYPSCYTVWDTDNFPELGDLSVGDAFSIEDSDDVSDGQCNDDYRPARLGFQAHVAPLDIVFNKNGSEAFITFHGSWNRDDPVGYKVVSVAFTDGQPAADSDSNSAARDVIYTDDLSNCPDNCFRPVGLAWDGQDRLFFSSDATGEIFVAQRDGGGGASSGGDEDEDAAGGDGDDEDGVLGLSQVAPRSAAWAVTFAAVVVGLLLT